MDVLVYLAILCLCEFELPVVEMGYCVAARKRCGQG